MVRKVLEVKTKVAVDSEIYLLCDEIKNLTLSVLELLIKMMI